MVQPRPSGVCSKSSGRGAPARWLHDRARVRGTVPGRHRHAEAWEQVPGAAHRLSTAFGVDEVGKCIASLMDAGMMIPASIQSQDPTEEYRIALTGMLIHGRRTVFVGLKRGEYKLSSSPNANRTTSSPTAARSAGGVSAQSIFGQSIRYRLLAPQSRSYRRRKPLLHKHRLGPDTNRSRHRRPRPPAAHARLPDAHRLCPASEPRTADPVKGHARPVALHIAREGCPLSLHGPPARGGHCESSKTFSRLSNSPRRSPENADRVSSISPQCQVEVPTISKFIVWQWPSRRMYNVGFLLGFFIGHTSVWIPKRNR